MSNDDTDVNNVVQKVGDQLKLVINKTDAVLIIGEDMSIKYVMKNVAEGEPIGMNAVLISAISTRLNLDPKFPQQLMDFVEGYESIDESGITMKMGDLDSMDTTGAADKIKWN